MLSGPVEDDADVRAALDWFGSVSGDAVAFRHRIKAAQESYCNSVAQHAKFGQGLALEDLGRDKVGSYLAQADSLLHNRGAYDLVLGSRIVPFIKQLGAGIKALRQMPGAEERASRMLRQQTVDPESAVYEMAIAVGYAREGCSVQFIPEIPGGDRRPDLAISLGTSAAEVECKRLQKGEYEKRESAMQREIFKTLAELIDDRKLSVHVDVIYTQELKDIPRDYLAEHVKRALDCRILVPSGFPWKDTYGEGRVRPADLDAVHRDTRQSSLMFGPRMARLLTGAAVSEGAYDMAVGAKTSSRDARFVDRLYYGSVVTWQCISEDSISARARFIRTKLGEADSQLKSSPAAIAHIAMDAERDNLAADLRRDRNMKTIRCFGFASRMAAVYLHYLVPRVTEVRAWMIDETIDRFGPSEAGEVPPRRIFDKSERLDNGLPAWRQAAPLPPDA